MDTIDEVFVPTHFSGEELYLQMGFFLFKQFGPIDKIIVESCELYHLKGRSA